jgi:hypothetical protein
MLDVVDMAAYVFQHPRFAASAYYGIGSRLGVPVVLVPVRTPKSGCKSRFIVVIHH